MKKIYIIVSLIIALVLSIPLPVMAENDSDCDLVYGIASSGEIHEVNPNDGSYTKVAEIDQCINTHNSGPNVKEDEIRIQENRGFPSPSYDELRYYLIV